MPSNINFSNTRWPPFKALLDQQDRLQRRIVLMALDIRKRPEDDTATFVRLRNAAVTRYIKGNKWSVLHVKRCVDWYQHLQRDHAVMPAAALLRHNDALYLQTLRRLRRPNSRTIGLGGICRLTSGSVAPRWEEEVIQRMT